VSDLNHKVKLLLDVDHLQSAQCHINHPFRPYGSGCRSRTNHLAA
jgi:hypothetical protein